MPQGDGAAGEAGAELQAHRRDGRRRRRHAAVNDASDATYIRRKVNGAPTARFRLAAPAIPAGYDVATIVPGARLKQPTSRPPQLVTLAMSVPGSGKPKNKIKPTVNGPSSARRLRRRRLHLRDAGRARAAWPARRGPWSSVLGQLAIRVNDGHKASDANRAYIYDLFADVYCAARPSAALQTTPASPISGTSYPEINATFTALVEDWQDNGGAPARTEVAYELKVFSSAQYLARRASTRRARRPCGRRRASRRRSTTGRRDAFVRAGRRDARRAAAERRLPRSTRAAGATSTRRSSAPGPTSPSRQRAALPGAGPVGCARRRRPAHRPAGHAAGRRRRRQPAHDDRAQRGRRRHLGARARRNALSPAPSASPGPSATTRRRAATALRTGPARRRRSPIVQLVSDYAAAAVAGTLSCAAWNLKCPLDPSLNVLDVLIDKDPEWTQNEDAATFRPVGRRYPVVVSA